jgi:hypothetical protein
MDTDRMDDDELAASAFVWRQRAAHGDKEAARVARELEAELKRRLGDNTPSSKMPLEAPPEPAKRPWWKFW